MEPIDRPLRTFTAFREESPDGFRSEFTATVFEAVPTEGESDYSCLVICPGLFDSPKRIYGVDADQAEELACAFLQKMFEAKGLAIAEVGTFDGPDDPPDKP